MENLDSKDVADPQQNEKESGLAREASAQVNANANFELNNNTINSQTTVIGTSGQKPTSNSGDQYTIKDNTISSLISIIGGKVSEEKNELNDTIANYIQGYNSSVSIKFSKNNISNEIKCLEESRILILDCMVDDGPLFGTVAKIADHEKFTHISKKRLNFDRGDKKDITFQFRSLVEHLCDKKDRLLIFFTNPSSICSNFFKQLLTIDFKSGLGEYQKMLRQDNCFIIIVVHEIEYVKLLNEKLNTQFIPRKSVDFLEYELLKVFDENQAEAFGKKIEYQRKNGKWSNDDSDFYNELVRSLEKGLDHFSALVEDDKSSVGNFRLEDKLVASKFIEDDDKLIKFISYVAVNFENISLNEFHYVVRSLISDVSKKEVITNPLKPEEKIERPLLERWNEDADILLRRLHLRERFSDQNDGKVIEFEKKGFRETFIEQFSLTSSWFSQQQFNCLFFEKGLLFNPETPYRILENFIRISAEIATNDPDMYCHRLLIYTTFSIITQEVKIDFKIDPGEDNLEVAFENFLKYVKDKHFELEIQKLVAFRKVGLLIAKMYTWQNLRERINDYFTSLINRRFHEAVFVLVKYLRNIPEFDTLYWVKQLIDRGDIQLKKEVFKFLGKYLFQSDQMVFDLLKKVKEWYSDKPKLVSDSAKAGICVIINYLSISISNIAIEDYGKFPVKFHLFNNVGPNSDELERIEFLSDWLMNPALKESYVFLDSFFDKDIESEFNEEVLAILIIQIKTILTGITGKETKNSFSDFSIQLGDKFIQAIVNKADKVQRKEIITGLNKWRTFYESRKREETTNSKQNRDIFSALSKTSSNIINHFSRRTNL
ncbi:MAG: hypothetical protein QM737_16715 [Ferruginibacter sp.]